MQEIQFWWAIVEGNPEPISRRKWNGDWYYEFIGTELEITETPILLEQIMPPPGMYVELESKYNYGDAVRYICPCGNTISSDDQTSGDEITCTGCRKKYIIHCGYNRCYEIGE